MTSLRSTTKYPKILVISAWYPNSLYPAEGDFIRYQSQLMKKEGLNVSVFHANLSIRIILKGVFIKKQHHIQKGLLEHIIEQPFWPRNSTKGIQKWAAAYKKELEKHCNIYGWPDIIHAHTYLGGYVASLIKKNFNIPYLVTLHETNLLDGTLPEYHQPLLKQALENANQIVAVGQKLSGSLKKYSNKNIVILPNFIDFEKFDQAPKCNDPFTFIFIGELIPRKRVNTLIQAFSQLNITYENTQLLIIGGGPLNKSLQKQASNLSVKNKIKFTGRLAQDEVALQLQKSHCLILPSKTETFGIVLVEAMACGLPFISTFSGTFTAFFNHPSCHFIGHSENELTAAMKKIYSDKTSYTSEEIRKYAYKNFSSTAVVSQYKNRFLSILEKA
ncbi:MAG: glycosyltransferase [Saprospiraceae bacterium]